MNYRVEAHYLPKVVRLRLELERRATLLGQSLSPRQLERHLLAFCTLRVTVLSSIPTWVRTSAEICGVEYPRIARQLCETAELEQEHLELLIRDLAELRARVGADGRSFPAHDPRIDRHARVRSMVPTRSEPLILIPIDLELAYFERAQARGLLVGDQVGCRYLRARLDDCERRIDLRIEQLDAILDAHRDRASAWGRVALGVVESYCGALEACADHGRTQSERPTLH